MMNGVVIGIVTDNADPDKMHRVKVEYPVDADEAPGGRQASGRTSDSEDEGDEGAEDEAEGEAEGDEAAATD